VKTVVVYLLTQITQTQNPGHVDMAHKQASWGAWNAAMAIPFLSCPIWGQLRALFPWPIFVHQLRQRWVPSPIHRHRQYGRSPRPASTSESASSTIFVVLWRRPTRRPSSGQMASTFKMRLGCETISATSTSTQQTKQGGSCHNSIHLPQPCSQQDTRQNNTADAIYGYRFLVYCCYRWWETSSPRVSLPSLYGAGCSIMTHTHLILIWALVRQSLS
jgi:hypothetical protein